MKDMTITNKYLDIISKTIKEYNLFLLNDSLVIGFSGGKDSLFTVLCLRELGYQFKVVTVDLGYEKNWDLKIRSIANTHNFNVTIINAKDNNSVTFFSYMREEEFQVRYDFLKDKSNYLSNNITPCTQCYNVKIILLENFANSVGSKKIILGHHKTDAIVSFLKSAFYYMDRWERHNTFFNYNDFMEYIINIKPIFLDNNVSFAKSNLFEHLKILANKECISSDESPRQDINLSPYKIEIARPLYFIDENIIINHIQKNKIATDDSDCGHSIAQNNITPREMIHYNIIYKAFKYNTYKQISRALFPLIEQNISSEGKLIKNLRNQRDLILGKQYKCNIDSLNL